MTASAQAIPRHWTRAADLGLTFRAVVDADLPFMARLYASTRSEELASTPWSEAEKAAFVEMQFQAQHSHYRQHYSDAEWLITMRAGEDIGRLLIQRLPGEHGLVDIVFLPAHCGKGYGGALLRDLLEEAAAAGKSVTIHVEKFNPAMRLYRRLGFGTVEDKGVYELMRWTAAPG
jgi:ribosomal protein S18 acetylase RimI-like enzyme